MASQNPPKKATAYTFPVSLVSQADTKLMQTSVTLAAGDITVSKDGGSFANIGTLPTEISTTGVLPVVLTSTEMDADYVVVRFRDASGAQWCDLTVVLQTVTNQFDALATSTALATAQADLDTLTGADGATLATAQGNYAPATVAGLATAQADLDTLTGTDGATLATSQPNYAPATATALSTTDGKVDTINTNAAAIKVVTDALTAAAAANLALSAGVMVPGAAEAGTLSTTQMTSDLAEGTNDHFNGRIVIWTSGALLGQATDITDYAGATGLLTFTAVTEAPGAGDTFIII